MTDFAALAPPPEPVVDAAVIRPAARRPFSWTLPGLAAAVTTDVVALLEPWQVAAALPEDGCRRRWTRGDRIGTRRSRTSRWPAKPSSASSLRGPRP